MKNTLSFSRRQLKSALPSLTTALSLLTVAMTVSADSGGHSHGGPNAQAIAKVDARPNTLLSNPRQLTHLGARAGEGYFSHDGRKMVFQSEREPGNPFYQIYLMDLASGRTNRVSPGKGKTTCAWIHPDGKRVLFSSTHLDPDTDKKAREEIEARKNPVQGRYSWSYDETYDLFSSSPDGRNLRRLTREKGYDAEGSYSPDGRWIAFASNRAGYGGVTGETMTPEEQKLFAKDPSYMMDIYIMRADGSDVRRLTTSRGYDGGPFFSPDSQRITWRRFTPDGSQAEIHTMKIDGSDQTKLTDLGAMSWAPFYHPSGDYLVFATNIHGYKNFELYIVAASGGRPVRVTNEDGFDGLPVFTPDGRQLSWTKRNEKGDSQIFMGDWDDAQARRLLNLPPRAPLTAKELAHEITPTDSRAWVEFFAASEMKGRATGSPEEARVQAAMIEAFRSWGLAPLGDKAQKRASETRAYQQRFTFTSGVRLGDNNQVTVEGAGARAWALGEDWAPYGFSASATVPMAPVVFVGYGISAPATEKFPEYDSYKNIDVKGKWVLSFRDVPEDASAELRQHLNLYSRPQHKATVARNHGAVGLILVTGPTNPSARLAKGGLTALRFEGGDNGLPVIQLTDKATESWMKAAKTSLKKEQTSRDKGEAVPGFEVPGARLGAKIDLKIEKSQSANVLALLKVPGAKKTFIIGAHGDHLGEGKSGSSLMTATDTTNIHFGADDNASGMAAVMELAHALSRPEARKRLRHNILFAIWSGEEIGTLGATHFAQSWANDNGGRKLDSDVSGYLNMDMIGRLREKLAVQGVGSSLAWKRLVEELAAKSKIPLVTQDDPYLPTDSMALYMAGVPTLSLFTGAHSEYHTPRDTPATLNYAGIATIAQLARDITERVAGPDALALPYEKVSGSRSSLPGEGRRFRIYLGTVPDYTQEGVKGVRISGVAKDGPAEKAGLKGGDTIIELDKMKIESIHDYVYSLQAVKPDKETTVVVSREGKPVELKITPQLKE